jgi:hypothetical protein
MGEAIRPGPDFLESAGGVADTSDTAPPAPPARFEEVMVRVFTPRLLGALLVALLTSNAARSETIDDAGLWLAVFAQGDVQPDGPLKWWYDGHARFLDDADGFHQSIVRPGLGWSLTENAAVWIGYGWIQTSPPAGRTFDEHRIWQQTTWSRDYEPFTFALRSRLEERFLETGDDVGLRFRQLVRAQHNLPQAPLLTLVAWDELFLNLNDTDWGAESGFDQNRLFLGVGWRPTPDAAWRTEIGYLNQTIHNPAAPDRSNHILSINFYR